MLILDIHNSRHSFKKRKRKTITKICVAEVCVLQIGVRKCGTRQYCVVKHTFSQVRTVEAHSTKTTHTGNGNFDVEYVFYCQ